MPRTLHPTVRAVTSVLLAIAQPLSTRLATWTGRGTPEVEQATATEGPVTPAGEAFVIWAPLFVGGLLYARTDLLAEPDDPAARAAGWWVDAALAGNILWSLNSQFRRLDRVSVVLIGGSAVFALTAVARAERQPDSRPRRAVHRYIAPLAGWLSVAAFANLETSLNRRRTPSPAEARTRAVGLVAAASIATAAVTASLRDGRTYAAAAGWGLTGIALKARRTHTPSVAVAATLGVIGLVAATHTPPARRTSCRPARRRWGWRSRRWSSQ